jgi:hypothetical protein
MQNNAGTIMPRPFGDFKRKEYQGVIRNGF